MSTAIEHLRAIYQGVSDAVDGGALIRWALANDKLRLDARATSVLALGKASFPMLSGLLEHLRTNAIAIRRGLLIVPASRFPTAPDVPPPVTALVADHPSPSERSVAAARAARSLVAATGPDEQLVVLLSGGGSSLLAEPASGISLDEKRQAVGELARAGATITELNTVRKHLSAIKGGRLALATRAQTTVLAMSDVIGNDISTIASGPFAADASTYAQALSLIRRMAPGSPTNVVSLLERGVAGTLEETPKPQDPRLLLVRHEIIAGPDRVRDEARSLAEARGLQTGVLWCDTEESVDVLAGRCIALAKSGARTKPGPHHGSTGGATVMIGNGEPSIVVTGNGRGGRATHLALLVARGIAGVDGAAFLAAGTDDRDGGGSANGAVVDSNTWAQALATGLDPEQALRGCDSERVFDALGLLVKGRGSSNLLDVHLLMTGA